MSKYFSFQRVGIYALLFLMLHLPMLHLHPEYEHVQSDVVGHQHQPAVHSYFFPVAKHGHEHQDNQDQHAQDLHVLIDTSHHSLSQVGLLPSHIGQSFQFFSVFKKNPLALDQDSLALSMLFHFQSGAPGRHNVDPLQVTHFSSPSLRAPPYLV
ncbi:MAG: hypothetical protein ACE5FY_04925 [Nitrospiria bacterium]